MVLRGSKIKSDNTKSLMCGGFAGTVSRTMVAPLDRVKILMQTTKNLEIGSIPVLWQTVRNEGFFSLWKGNILNCTRIFPYSALQFGVYDFCKAKFNMNNNTFTTKHRLVCGSIAGLVATTFTHPIDVIRHRVMCYSHINSTRDAIFDLYKEKGIRSIYKGYGSTAFSLTPFIAVNFCAYDMLKAWWRRHGVLDTLCLGAASALISQSICYPLDTVRRRMQLRGTEYRNGLHAFVLVVRTEGITALYAGMIPNMIKIVPNNAIRFCVYEMCRQLNMA